MSNEITKHLVIDVQTGFAYGLKLAGNTCKGIQALNVSVEAMDGRVVQHFGLPVAGGSPVLPYGKTSYAIEMKSAGEGVMFTIAWPTKAEAAKGALPQVAQKPLPKDLSKAGLAAMIAKEGGKGAGVDDPKALENAMSAIDAMIGLDNAKRDIKQNIAIAQFNRAKQEIGLPTKPISRHMVFTGNPGTGKTTFAREVAKVYHALGFIEKAEVLEVTREDLVAGYVGQTAIKTKEAIEKAKGGILFIDEAYTLSQGGEKDFGQEAIGTLVAAMENMRDNLIVIVAGYNNEMKQFIEMNPGLKSRFMTYIDFEDYDIKNLNKILDSMLGEMGYTITDEARSYVTDMLEKEKERAGQDFGNAREVRNLVQKMEKELAGRLQAENKLGKDSGLSVEELKTALTTITLDDVTPIKMGAIDAQHNGRISFALAGAKKVPANDQKPSVKNQKFGM